MARIIAILGKMGSGKTCFLTYLMYLDYKAGRKVVADYGLKFPNTYLTLDQIATLPDEIQGASVAVDEIHEAADSRSIFKKGNAGVTKLVSQIRKRKCVFYYTTQVLKKVDKRIRDVTDMFITCDPYGQPVRFVDGQPEYHYFIIRVYNDRFGEPMKEFIFHGAPFFDLYDTNEIITFNEEN